MKDNTKESKQEPLWKTKKALIAYMLSVLLACLVAYIHGIQRVDSRKLDRLISQNLPIGTDQATVMKFLDSNHIPHSEYIREYKRMYADIPKSTIGLVNGQIHIEFRFDEEGRLVKYELHELFPGL
jgi:methyl coenzyme M reductase subunit C-like uncharacterized protein (methanogenesis marker protein 7)